MKRLIITLLLMIALPALAGEYVHLATDTTGGKCSMKEVGWGLKDNPVIFNGEEIDSLGDCRVQVNLAFYEKTFEQCFLTGVRQFSRATKNPYVEFRYNPGQHATFMWSSQTNGGFVCKLK